MRSALLLLAPVLCSGYAVATPQELDIDLDLYGDWQAPGPDDGIQIQEHPPRKKSTH